MTTWIIEPRDPLIVRDGRPFSAEPGARAISLPFPFPSTTTGGARSRAALNKEGVFDIDSQQDKDRLEALKRIRMRGPILVQLTDNGHDIEKGKWLVAAPSDALLLEGKPEIDKQPPGVIRQLIPFQLPGRAQTDLIPQDSNNQNSLFLVGQPLINYDKRKSMKGVPSFWHWDVFQAWLLHPDQLDGKEKQLSDLGLSSLSRDQRLHVSIDYNKEAARSGMLFETSGLEFTLPGKGEQRLHNAKRLALAVDVDDNSIDPGSSFALRPGLTGFAGERRIMTWRKSSVDLPLCPAELEKAIITNKACRIILLTPAYFEQGYRPTWLLQEATRYGVTAQLKAVAIQRPQVISGWDLALCKPKPSRRLAPAGTVLFLSLKGSPDDAISSWVRDTWLHAISDDRASDEIQGVKEDPEQDRLDGFGLAALGTWPANH